MINTADIQKQFPWARVHSLDYPVRLDALGSLLEEIRASHSPHEQEPRQTRSARLIGDSPETTLVRKLMRQVAPSTATVLICGESGTGKEVVARRIHDLSGRKGQFVAVNCGAIPDQLLESELFGHERGAFTGASAARAGRFEQAAGGTFFLDEIGDMPTAMQVKLLRVIEERVIERVGGMKPIPVDVRLIAATHRNLPERIEAGQFREDLFYRLSVFPIDIAPLRERPSDVALLVDKFVQQVRRNHHVNLQFSDDAMHLLKNYSWPGNVRELVNLVERLAVVRPNGVVAACHLPWPLNPDTDSLPEVLDSTVGPSTDGSMPILPAEGVDLKAHLANIERKMIDLALDESDGVVQRAADLLGIGRTTLAEKIRRMQQDELQ